jgi:hypothetical protein
MEQQVLFMSEQIVFCPVTKTKGTNHSKADSEIIYTFSYIGILSIKVYNHCDDLNILCRFINICALFK